MKLTRGWRIALIVGAVAIAAIAFVLARPGGDEDEQQAGAATDPVVTETNLQPETEPTTAPPEPEPSAPAPAETRSPQPAEASPTPASPPPEPTPVEPEAMPVQRIRIENRAPVGGIQEVNVSKGDQVRFNVLSDLPDEIHLHGYDITRTTGPGNPARFRFTADFEGVFGVEAHDAGHVIVARVVVEP